MHAGFFLKEFSRFVQQLHDVARLVAFTDHIDDERSEFLGIDTRVIDCDRIVLLLRHICQRSFGDGQGIIVFQLPGNIQPPAPHVGRILLPSDPDRTRFLLLHLFCQHDGSRVEPDQRVVEFDVQLGFGGNGTGRGKLVGKRTRLLRFDPLFAGSQCLLFLLFELLALFSLLFRFDIPPGQFQLLGRGKQPVEGVVLHVGNFSPDGIGQTGRRNVEPQRDHIAVA